jgi:hypothetical protein
MSADERNRRLEEAHATLAELARRYDERNALNGSWHKINTVDEAHAWLAEKVSESTYTQAEIEKRLDEFIEPNRRRDAGRSDNEVGEA